MCKSTEDEHDVVWFWLEKGKPHECPVCSQYFKVNYSIFLPYDVLSPSNTPPPKVPILQKKKEEVKEIFMQFFLIIYYNNLLWIF